MKEAILDFQFLKNYQGKKGIKFVFFQQCIVFLTENLLRMEILRFCSETVSSKVSKIIIFMCVLIKCLSSVIKCVQFCSKVNFITNIINSTRIHIFYFYNNKHTFINTNTIFITKHTNFIKINIDSRDGT
jgi:hypothetical protein